MPTVTLTFKTTEAKARALRRAARARKMTLSDYLRRAADQAAETPPAPASEGHWGKTFVAAHDARLRRIFGDLKREDTFDVRDFIG